MAYVFNLPALGALSTTGARVQIDIPDLTTETGWKSYWYLPSSTGGSGSDTFIGLTDVPASFTGSGSYIVRVNGAETALEFIELSTLETDPVFSAWLISTPPAYPGDIPSIVGLLDETAHDLLDHTGLTGIPSISGLLDETAHDLLDHTGLIGVGTGDMTLAGIQSVTGLKTFDKTKIAIKGTSTGANIIDVVNTSATDYTNILPAKSGNFAMIDDISNISYIDGSIGDTSSDFTTLASAQTAGKVKLKMSSNLTFSADFTLTSNMTIDLNGYTLICGVYTITRSSGSLKIYCSSRIGGISFGYSSSKYLFTSFTISTLTIIDLGLITNSSTVDSTYIAPAGYFRNISNIILPNKAFGGFNCTAGSYIENIKMTGGGSGCYAVIFATSCIVNNITLTGSFRAGDATLYFATCTVDGIIEDATTGIVIQNNDSKVNGIIRIAARDITLVSSASAHFSNCDFTIMSTGNNSRMMLTNCNCKAAFNLASNNSCKMLLINCYFSSTFVINAFANRDKVFISNCIFAGDTIFPVTNWVAGSKVIGCEFNGTLTINTDGIQFIGCSIDGASTLSADYMKIIDNIFTGASTLSSGSEYNIITGNTLTGGLTDSSASTSNIIKDNVQ